MNYSFWQSGKQLNGGKFVVESKLGSGGFGITYKIVKPRTQERFVVKTLNDIACNKANFAEIKDDFFNEAIRLAKFNHPGIVKIYPRGFSEDKLWCMVMEFIEGQNLAEYLEKNQAISEVDAIALITKVGKALTYVHESNYVHRDIKPSNIMLRNCDLSSPVLIDFGLAREFDPNRSLTMDSKLTEHFAPLEQYDLDSLSGYINVNQNKYKVGTWTDVYSLAATLYNLLTTKMPMAATFRQLVPTNFKPPKQLNPKISDRTNAAILRGMELEPANRPQSVEEWLSLLEPDKKNYNTLNLGTKLQVFEFNTIKIDRFGKTINRSHHSVKYYAEDLGDDINLEMIVIPDGELIHNLADREKNKTNNTTYQKLLRIPSFYIAKFPITQRQWQQVAKLPQIKRKLHLKPAQFSGLDLPVENISWYDAIEFCQRLSQATGKQYRLPSEAQWEYACRAKTTTPFSFGQTITSEIANYNGRYTYADEIKGEYRKTTTPVNKFLPNAFGLYSMHGNVWEWCADDWQDNYQNISSDRLIDNSSGNQIKVIRGGSWGSRPAFCSSTHRDRFIADNFNNFIGFRCVIEI